MTNPEPLFKEWWPYTPLRRWTMIATAISITMTTIVGVMNLGGIAEPFWLATRQYTRDLVQTAERSTTTRLLALEISNKESARDASQSKLDSLEIELRKNPEAPDSIKQLINEQVRRYNEQLRILNYELDDLRRQRAGRRP